MLDPVVCTALAKGTPRVKSFSRLKKRDYATRAGKGELLSDVRRNLSERSPIHDQSDDKSI
jgi:hypothetical protein